MACAQGPIEGIILDEETEEPLSGVTIEPIGLKGGTSSEASGKFSIHTGQDSLEVRISLMAYQTKTVTIYRHRRNVVELRAENNTIESVTVRAKGKYSNRNNPAVELIDLVIRHKHQNRLSGKDRIQFDQYDKLKVGMIDPKPFFRKALSSLNYIFDNIDTLTLPGHGILNLYQEENQSKVYSQKDPSRYKKIVEHQKKTDFNERYINNPNIQSYLNYVFQPVDIYDESIFMLNKLFLSPIADNGKIYYKYYIVDTVDNEHGRFIKLDFVPRNNTDLLFAGHLMVSMDGRYAIKSAYMQIDRSANINWVNYVHIDMDYSPNEEGIMLMDTSRIAASFGGRDEAVYGERVSIHHNYDLSSPVEEGVFRGAPIELSANSSSEIPNRPIGLTPIERTTYQDIEALNQDRNFKATLAIGYLIAQSYYNAGKFELGPVEYTYSRNNVEGNRFRIGGRSTPLLSEKIYLEGYLAYGDLDNKFKYFLRTAVSLNGSSVATFPAHYLEATVQQDILDPGRQISMLRGDSFFQSFRKNRPTKWFDTDAYRLRHIVEFGNHVSIATGFQHTRRKTVGDFRLVSSGDPNELVRDMNTNEASVVLRWAPYEKFYYRNLERTTVIEHYPVFSLEYNKGLKGFWGGMYDYDMLKASVSKRFFLNQLGFADMTVTGGKIWGTLPYTLLHMPNVKQPVDRHDIEFDLMNSLEFAADQYVKMAFRHKLQGFIFNKIPLLKRLKLREVWEAQMFYGKLSNHNNPLYRDDVVEFDTDSEGVLLTRALDRKPYWEASAGIDNILRILKVEYVRRLTYRDFPHISKDRYRVSLSINF